MLRSPTIEASSLLARGAVAKEGFLGVGEIAKEGISRADEEGGSVPSH